MLLEVSWAIPPKIFSGPSTSNAGYRGPVSDPSYAAYRSPVSGSSYASPPSGPEFVPGELLRVESTKEVGGYESESQEKGLPPPPTYDDAVVFTSPPQHVASMGYYGGFYPFDYYDWMFITGQYPTGTYTHSSSSIERGRDDWQENHYVKNDDPSSPVLMQQPFPNNAGQLLQASGPGDQQGAGWDMRKGMRYY